MSMVCTFAADPHWEAIALSEGMMNVQNNVTDIDRLVWGARSSGLGDHWATVNYLLTLSSNIRREILLSTLPARWHGHLHRSERFPEILKLMISSGRIRLVDYPPTALVDRQEIWNLPYHFARFRWFSWINLRSRRICYQHDAAVTFREASLKSEYHETFLSSLRENGYEGIALKASMSLEEVVKNLSTCAAFVGPSSGFAHICHSVGTPLYLVREGIELQELIRHHVGKQYILCHSWDDFLGKFLAGHSRRFTKKLICPAHDRQKAVQGKFAGFFSGSVANLTMLD